MSRDYARLQGDRKRGPSPQGDRKGRPYHRRSGEPRPCMVGAGLAPALGVGRGNRPFNAKVNAYRVAPTHADRLAPTLSRAG